MDAAATQSTTASVMYSAGCASCLASPPRRLRSSKENNPPLEGGSKSFERERESISGRGHSSDPSPKFAAQIVGPPSRGGQLLYSAASSEAPSLVPPLSCSRYLMPSSAMS